MPLKLTYQLQTKIPVEIEGFTPKVAAGLSMESIRNFEIFYGNRKVPLSDAFEFEGDPADLAMEFHGDVSGVHWIGAHMEAGTVTIHGNGGRHVGSAMRGGTIEVHGHAGDWVGGEMRGGRIHVHGNAGHLIGAGYRGSRIGMRGGMILIDGNVGNEIGHTMRRGLIAVGGTAGDLIGFNMKAGSIFVFGECGIRPGAGMHRGTIGLFGKEKVELLPTFRRACSIEPIAIQLVFRKLLACGFPLDPALLKTSFEFYNGDLLDGGRGEVLLCA